MMASTPYNREYSVGSDSDFSPGDPILALPYDAVVEIFQYVPPNELVSVCRLVSKTWKSFFDDPKYWLLGITKSGNFDPKLNEIPVHTVNWPLLFINSAWRPNLIRSFKSNGELSLDFWTKSYKKWEAFSMRLASETDGLSKLFDVGSDDKYGGGNEWNIEAMVDPFTPRNKQLLKENNQSYQNYVTSYEWCCREQMITLSEFGFTHQIMDTLQPAILVSEWFAGRWDCGSIFKIRVELVGSKGQVINKYEDSVETDQWQGGWRRVEHMFCDYGPDVRYIRFADGGKDTKYWAGHYGSKMAGAQVRVRFKV